MPAIGARQRVIVPEALRNVPALSVVECTGDLTAVAAETASAGHLFTLLHPDAVAEEFLITRLRLWIQVNVSPSTQQGFGVALKKISHAAPVDATGGAAASVRSRAEGTVYAVPAYTGRIATTGALTAGTYTLGAKIAELFGYDLVAAATVAKSRVEREWCSHDGHPIAILGQKEGIVLANQVLMANSLAMKVGIELDGYARSLAA